MQFAYVSLPGRGANDRFLAVIAARLRAQGLRLAGTVQTNIERSDRVRCDMDVLVLPDGPVLRISEDRGNLARGCRLDADALERAVVGTAAALPHAQFMIVNKFGKQEADGRGLAPLIAEALSRGIPVLLGVNGLNLASFETFSSGMAVQLQPEEAAVMNWCKIAIAECV
ncbi:MULTISPECIES: DUF2478 domain-containing protein [Paracoccus]|jgi:hypothetical protein|uniref:DUF2478 domain-containing protein n=2 Tax=Paracoccus TaxID=265 RepID=A0A844H522_9RHOB|nr:MULTISPECIES: DUF2478 domain-containing protein [Paracoccus]MTH35892.1 DUF2478 domain-containing protein [Paracoccus limosus]RCW78236.1 uncharacterized protein DUF2478 [Paracoccus lutimaris]